MGVQAGLMVLFYFTLFIFYIYLRLRRLIYYHGVSEAAQVNKALF